MNIIRSISDGRARIPYTVVGGPRRDRVRRYPYALTFLVVGRGDRLFKSELLKDLQGRGLGEVLWVEGAHDSTDVEPLARDFPDVRFLLLKEGSTPGDRVNIGIEESRAPLVMVLWSDTRLGSFPADILGPAEKSGTLCTVPVARGLHEELIPTWQSPLWKRRRFSLAFHVPRVDGERILYPFDYCGLYDRLKFAQSGGFDPAIRNPYWQKLDFGLRCFLWGERLQGTTRMSLAYTGAPPEEDTTPDEGYKIAWLKNMAVRVRREMGVLPGWRMLDYMVHSDTGPVSAVQEFRAVRRWVHRHRFRFRRDPRDLMDGWEHA